MTPWLPRASQCGGLPVLCSHCPIPLGSTLPGFPGFFHAGLSTTSPVFIFCQQPRPHLDIPAAPPPCPIPTWHHSLCPQLAPPTTSPGGQLLYGPERHASSSFLPSPPDSTALVSVLTWSSATASYLVPLIIRVNNRSFITYQALIEHLLCATHSPRGSDQNKDLCFRVPTF